MAHLDAHNAHTPWVRIEKIDSQTLSQTSELALGAGKIMDQMDPNKLANKAQAPPMMSLAIFQSSSGGRKLRLGASSEASVLLTAYQLKFGSKSSGLRPQVSDLNSHGKHRIYRDPL